MDIFGFATQGINYDKFRPKYPPFFYNNSLNLIKHKNRYMDVATGTGQLLFAIAQHFSFSKAIDISPQMVAITQENLVQYKKNHPHSNICIQHQDVMELDEDQKYDLITVGQALHFFPIKPALKKIKQLLNSEGYFVTFGYVLRQVKSNNEQQNEYFYDFYSKVKPLFTFDRDDLHSHYSNKSKYSFEEVFSSVSREVAEVKLEMRKEQYVAYLKTMSGYNLYLKNESSNPLSLIIEKGANQVTCIFDYFRITCCDKQ